MGWGDVTYWKEGVLFLKQDSWGGKAVKVRSAQVERLT